MQMADADVMILVTMAPSVIEYRSLSSSIT